MINKSLLLAFGLSLLGYSASYGQTSVNAAGGEASGTGGEASFTIGEAIFTDPSGDGGISLQGVQQSYEFVTGIDELASVELLLNIFPNPASSTVTLSIAEPNVTDFRYRMYDLNGKLLLENRVQADLTLIPIENYPDATYLLEVLLDSRPVKSFTIIKNR
jgi:hypothetical protein